MVHVEGLAVLQLKMLKRVVRGKYSEDWFRYGDKQAEDFCRQIIAATACLLKNGQCIMVDSSLLAAQFFDSVTAKKMETHIWIYQMKHKYFWSI
jgi:hypothetical protein